MSFRNTNVSIQPSSLTGKVLDHSLNLQCFKVIKGVLNIPANWSSTNPAFVLDTDGNPLSLANYQVPSIIGMKTPVSINWNGNLTIRLMMGPSVVTDGVLTPSSLSNYTLLRSIPKFTTQGVLTNVGLNVGAGTAIPTSATSNYLVLVPTSANFINDAGIMNISLMVLDVSDK
jgi:hypothetical protein